MYVVVNRRSRHQPWSTYAVYLTTVSHWALAWDSFLIYLFFDMTKCWPNNSRDIGLATLISWMFLSKFLKLLGHYVRYPGDFLLLPVSIFFGYFHGFIKGYAMLSLNVVRASIYSLVHTLAYLATSNHNLEANRVHRLLGAAVRARTMTMRIV